MISTALVLQNNVLLELRDKYPTLKKADIRKIMAEYYKVVHKILTYGNKVNDRTYAKRIKIPHLGSFNYNYNVLRRATEGPIIQMVDDTHFRSVNTMLYLMGWQLLKWTKLRGYMFYNEITGEEFNIKKEHIKGRRQAVVYFYNYIDDNDKQNMINELNYDGKFFKCSNEGRILEVIKDTETLEEVYKDSFVNIIKSVIYNGGKLDSNNSMKVGSSIWVREVDYEKRGIIRDINKPVKHSYLIDIIDKNSGEVIYKEYGTVKDCSEFVKITGGYLNPNPSNIVKELGTGNTVYGHKWKKS